MICQILASQIASVVESGNRQNYCTDWRQTLRNYEERPRECPPGVEIARLSALGEISWDFRFLLKVECPISEQT